MTKSGEGRVFGGNTKVRDFTDVREAIFLRVFTIKFVETCEHRQLISRTKPIRYYFSK